MTNAYEIIYSIVKQIPSGKVATYGQIAKLSGNMRWSRVVGYAMNSCSDNEVPCHRVVNRFGEVSSAFEHFGNNMQVVLLKEEGVKFIDIGRVDIDKFKWNGQLGDIV